MRSTRSLAVGVTLALAACAPDLPTGPASSAAPAGLGAVAAAAPPPVCIEFGPPPPLGTTWGVPTATPPGSWILTENGVPMWIDRLFLPGGVTVYNFARIGISPVPIGAGQQMLLDRSSLRFDFSNVGFPVSAVTWEWFDPGTSTIENMAVNGGARFIGDITAPAFVSGHPYGATWAAAGGGRRGRSKVGGPVRTLLVGGQQLWIDRVCAHP
ncbi:MAG TPA: hypothetical protein VHG51_20125 [Longimicrobiaceae bacterium]|nr:hypothetical protein [Longimicrobiaceae bacterium]